MRTALVNGRLLTQAGSIDGQAVVIEGGLIVSVEPREAIDRELPTHDLRGAMLAPGFIDSQVNGGGGLLFNDSPTVETIRRIGEAHRRFGTTGFLPTLISDSLDKIAAAIAAADAAIAAKVPGVLGIHLEGPFLSTARKGVHDPAHFRTLEPAHVELLTSLEHGRTLITLAPEQAAPDLIAALVARGAVVALGHSDTSYETAVAAFEAGATGVTHLFNAMSQLRARAPGLVGAALDRDDIWCPLIVDGHHAAPASMRVALRCKPEDRLMLVTDAMPSVGGEADGFELFGRAVTVRGGACTTAEGTLAGSHLDMASAVRNAVAMLGVAPERAAAMASTYPAQFLRLGDRFGRIAPGHCASLVALDDAMRVTATWIDGIIKEEDVT